MNSEKLKTCHGIPGKAGTLLLIVLFFFSPFFSFIPARAESDGLVPDSAIDELLFAVNEKGPANIQDKEPGPYFFYLDSLMKRRSGDLAGSDDSLQKALAMDPGSLFLKKELASLKLARNMIDDAEALFDEMLKIVPDDIQSLISLGKIKQFKKDYDAAAAVYRRVLELDPEQKEIYLFLGRTYLEKGEVAKAEEIFLKQTKRFDDAFAAYFFLGRIYKKNNRIEDAVSMFKRALDVEPRLLEPRFELLKIYRKKGDVDKAIAVCDEILKEAPGNIKASLAKAEILLALGSKKDADGILLELGKRLKQDPLLTREMVEEYIEKERYKDAALLLEGMLPADPSGTEINFFLGLAYEGLKKTDKAILHFEKVGYDHRFYPNAAIRLSFLYRDKKRKEDALAVLENAAASPFADPEVFLYLGAFLEEEEEFDRAIDALKKGLLKDPKNIKILFRLGVVLDKSGKKDECISIMKKVIGINPDHVDALNYLGYTYADLGKNLDEAETLIKRALSRRPDDGYITDSLGWVYFKKEEYEKALPLLEKAAEKVPKDPIILEHLGDVYQKLGKIDKSLKYYKRALEMKKKDKDSLLKKIRAIKRQQGR